MAKINLSQKRRVKTKTKKKTRTKTKKEKEITGEIEVERNIIKETAPVLIIMVVILLIVVGFFYYQHYEKQEQNYQFTKDLIHCLAEIKASRGDKDEKNINEDEESQFLRGAYIMQEHLVNARNDIEKWSNNKDNQIRKIATEMLEGIDDLFEANDSYINIVTKENNNIDSATKKK